jgi:hypothetical protein
VKQICDAIGLACSVIGTYGREIRAYACAGRGGSGWKSVKPVMLRLTCQQSHCDFAAYVMVQGRKVERLCLMRGLKGAHHHTSELQLDDS